MTCKTSNTHRKRRIAMFDPLMINVPHHIETSPLICIANQLTSFFLMGNIGR